MTAFECRAQAEAEAGVELSRAEKVAPVLQCSVAIKPSEPRPAWHDCSPLPPYLCQCCQMRLTATATTTKAIAINIKNMRKSKTRGRGRKKEDEKNEKHCLVGVARMRLATLLMSRQLQTTLLPHCCLNCCWGHDFGPAPSLPWRPLPLPLAHFYYCCAAVFQSHAMSVLDSTVCCVCPWTGCPGSGIEQHC